MVLEYGFQEIFVLGFPYPSTQANYQTSRTKAVTYDERSKMKQDTRLLFGWVSLFILGRSSYVTLHLDRQTVKSYVILFVLLRNLLIVAFLLITWKRMVLVSYVDVVSYVPITQIGLAVATTNRWIRLDCSYLPISFFW